jgi:predicted nucleotidyltransferase
MTVADQTIIEQESIQKLITILVTKIDPDKIILFGSRTTKDFHADSDYDLCIIKKDVVHRRQLAQEVYKLLYGSGLSVDVIVETPERFLELKDNPYLIYQQIETKGRLLYDKQRSR